jgi:hypothetical protein
VRRVGSMRRCCTRRRLVGRRPPFAQRRGKQVRGSHRVLDREVDADAAHGDIACAASPMQSRPGGTTASAGRP